MSDICFRSQATSSLSGAPVFFDGSSDSSSTLSCTGIISIAMISKTLIGFNGLGLIKEEILIFMGGSDLGRSSNRLMQLSN